MDRFQDKTVVITGAGSGIGQAAAAKMLAEGAWVLGADRDVSGVPEGCERMVADVTDEAQVEALVRRAVEARGRLDIMCNNAGIGSTKAVVDITADEWDRVFAVNARGVFFGCKHACRQMLQQGGGVIVNTGSVAGMIGLKDRAVYCASKGAVIALTKQIAVQYAQSGIRCNAVCPGTVDSPWVGRLLDEADDPSKARDSLVARQPLGRLGSPEEVATAICYLASDDAAFVTGSTLVIDGGILAG